MEMITDRYLAAPAGRQLGMAQLKVQQVVAPVLLPSWQCQQHSVAQQGFVASHGADIPNFKKMLVMTSTCWKTMPVYRTLTDKSYLEAQDTLYILLSVLISGWYLQ